jgi:ankyrin repeat protein
MQPSGDRKAESLRAAASDTKLTQVQNLLAEGVDPNATDPWGRTPLQLAVRYAYNDEAEALKIVQALLAAGADINAADADGYTPLSHAAVYGYADLVKYLIAEGVEINPRDAEGMTPIAMIEAAPSIRGQRRRIIKMLEQAGGVR